MRIANCTRLRIPIFICNRANSSSFALCGMRQLCADAEDVALVWQHEHRHAVKTTESGHKRSSTHGGKENLVARNDLSLLKFDPQKHFAPLNPTRRIHPPPLPPSPRLISIHPRNMYSSLGRRHSHTHTGEMSLRHIFEGLMADVFLKYNPVWGRRHTVQVVRRAQGRGESHIHPDVSQWSQPRHRIEIYHRSWAPSTPTTDIHKIPVVFSLFFNPRYYNDLKHGSNKTIHNTNKMTWRKRHKSHCTESDSVGGWWESMAPVAERPDVCNLHWQQVFPRVTAAVLTFPLWQWRSHGQSNTGT